MTATTLIALPIILECLLLGGAKVVGAPSMRLRAAHVGFTVDQYRPIGALEILAAAGLAVGFAVPLIGVLAACGLLVLMGGALVAHIKAGDGPQEIAPAVVVAVLVIAYLVAAAVS
ncbi:MAG TPA: DoxX family protein [Frankiaceae bacterium]|nr:DoxX family protein [Frankiaceae bacterium]